MKSVAKIRLKTRQHRHRRIRKKISGTGDRPRLHVYRSLKHIYATLVNDAEDKCLVTVSSLCGEVKDVKGKTAASTAVGKLLAEKAKDMGITKVTFDRGGFIYHGRVKAVAEAAREGGLEL